MRGLTAFHLYVSCEVNAPRTVVTLPVCMYTVLNFTFPRAFPSATACSSSPPHAACPTSHSTQTTVYPNTNDPSVSVSPYQCSLCSYTLDCCAPFPMLTPSTLPYCFPLPVVLKFILYDFLFEAIYIRAFPLTAISGRV